MNSCGGTPATAGFSFLRRLPEEEDCFIEDCSMMDYDSPRVHTFSLLAMAIAIFMDLSFTKFCTSRTVDLLTFDYCVISLGLKVHSWSMQLA